MFDKDFLYGLFIDYSKGVVTCIYYYIFNYYLSEIDFSDLCLIVYFVLNNYEVYGYIINCEGNLVEIKN